MNLIQKTYKENKSRVNKRKMTSDFIMLIKNENVKRVSKCKVYFFDYYSNSCLTDKWHRRCVTFVTKIEKDMIEGYNLLYLNENTCLNFLSIAYSNPGYTFEDEKMKNELLSLKIRTRPYKINNVIKIVEIPTEDWGKIPLLNRSQFGNINFIAMSSDWEKENLTKKITKRHKEKIKKEIEEIETLELEEGNATIIDIKKELYENADLYDDEQDIY